MEQYTCQVRSSVFPSGLGLALGLRDREFVRKAGFRCASEWWEAE